MLHYFVSYSLQGVDRANNTVANVSSKLATPDASSFNGSMYLEVLSEPTIVKKVVMEIEHSNFWLTPYLGYLSERKLPSDRILAKKIKHQSSCSAGI